MLTLLRFQLSAYDKFDISQLTANGKGLAKVANFTTNVDAENQTLINHKCVCGALNRHFCG
jgi:NADPH-dependent 7-cyano-7-deazaguanine reductase QueF-like protein